MKLIQLNIWQGKILIAVSRFLKEQDADIVCLQEVFSSKDPETFVLLDMLSSLELLQRDLAYPHVYFEPTCTFTLGDREYSFGNAILSKLPLKNREVIFTNGEFYTITDRLSDYTPNTRNALLCTVEGPEGEFNLITHHGYHEMTPLGSDKTIEKMRILADKARTLKGPLILAGDLNVIAESPSMRVFDDWLEDLTSTYKIKDTLSEFGKARNVPCDHILVSDDVRVKQFSVSSALVSDHFPLILEFDL